MNTTTNLEYLPWTWTVRSSDPNAHCPSASSILGTFAIVNVLVSLVGLIFGNRVVTNYISCGFFGNLGSKAWHYMWIFTIALHLGANTLNASIIKHTAGYEKDFSITQLMIFFIARPRLGWILMSAISPMSRKSIEKELYFSPRKAYSEFPKDGPLYSNIPAAANDASFVPSSPRKLSIPALRVTSSESPKKVFLERPWETSFFSQLIAEVVLQLINLSTTGRIAYFAASHGYYKLNQDYYSLPHGAHLMYAGALLYTIALPLFLVANPQFILLIRIWKAARDQKAMRDRTQEDGDVTIIDNRGHVVIAVFVWGLAISTWLASWLIWTGYVLLAGDLWILPSKVVPARTYMDYILVDRDLHRDRGLNKVEVSGL